MSSWKRRIECAVVAALLGLSATGCYKATFYSDPTAVRGESHDQWTSFFIFGLVGHEKVDVHEFCPAGSVAEVATGGNFGTGLVSGLTLGIYTPRKVYVTCSGGTTNAASSARLTILADAAGKPRRVERMEGERVAVGTVRELPGDRPSFRVDFNEEGAVQ
jgi:hypothetical protein